MKVSTTLYVQNISFQMLYLSVFLKIDNLSPEWQYLFDQAGVTREMLEDRDTLQFILDTVYKLGGAPQKLDLTQDEGTCTLKIWQLYMYTDAWYVC